MSDIWYPKYYTNDDGLECEVNPFGTETEDYEAPDIEY